MKKIFLAAVLCAASLGANAQTGKFHVAGSMTEPCDSVVVYSLNFGAGRSKESGRYASPGGKFDINTDLADNEFWYIVGRKDGQFIRSSAIQIPALKGENAVLSPDADGKGYTISGTQIYRDYDAAQNSIKKQERELSDFTAECREMMGRVSEDSVENYYQSKAPALQEQVRKAAFAYIKDHPDNEAASSLVTSAAEDANGMEAAAGLLSPEVQNGRFAPMYKSAIAMLKKQEEKEKRAKELQGGMAPDFTLNDINGKPLALSSLRGKYVVIDFWGSWCGWCIKGMPKMKEYYEKYKGKLEILGVDCNDTQEKWKAAVEKEQLPWLHVYNDKKDDNDPTALYAVQGYPTKVVVDPDGKIAKIIVGEDPEFYSYLDSVLK